MAITEYLAVTDLVADVTASGSSLFSFAAVAVTTADVAANYIFTLGLLLIAAAFISIIMYINKRLLNLASIPLIKKGITSYIVKRINAMFGLNAMNKVHPLDKLITDDSLWLLESVVAFVDYPFKRMLVMLIKYKELMSILNCLNNKSFISECGFDCHPKNSDDMIMDMCKFMPGEYAATIHNMKNIMNMMNVMNSNNDSNSDYSNTNFSNSGMNNINPADLMKAMNIINKMNNSGNTNSSSNINSSGNTNSSSNMNNAQNMNDMNYTDGIDKPNSTNIYSDYDRASKLYDDMMSDNNPDKDDSLYDSVLNILNNEQ